MTLSHPAAVHHKNGVKNDNRIGNLELRAGAHGVGVRPLDQVEHAVGVLLKYAPELIGRAA